MRSDHTFSRLLLVALLALLGAGCAASEHGHFHTEHEGELTPWTHLAFENDPRNFQFVIVSDHTGGGRPGVFESAIERTNWLRPEFVISVGDLIEGGTSDAAAVNREWDQFDDWLERLKMPFFRVAGNHDITNPTMADIWTQRFGPSWYGFVYRDVLFLCLNTEDGGVREYEGSPHMSPGFSNEQLAYAKQVLDKHTDVRWTLLFMHEPLWRYDGAARAAFTELEAMLENRDHTIFAGHFHSYMKYPGKDSNRYILATTGGTSQLRGPLMGEFDHITWVTMTDDGPVMSNLMLDGILPDDVRTPALLARQQRLLESINEHLPMQLQKGSEQFNRRIEITMENTEDEALGAQLTWHVPEASPWHVEPRRIALSAQPGETARAVLNVTLQRDAQGNVDRLYPVPAAQLDAHSGGAMILENMEIRLVELEQVIAEHPREAVARQTQQPPTIDGRLNDQTWQQPAQITQLTERFLRHLGSAPTRGWVSYDAQNLYIAARCTEPNPAGMRLEAKTHDGPVWKDDSLELLIDADFDRERAYHILINANGVLFDRNHQEAAWNGGYESAAHKDEQGWSVELAIPWHRLGRAGPPASGEVIGFNLVRNRPQADTDNETAREIAQWSPTLGQNLYPARLGRLRFE